MMKETRNITLRALGNIRYKKAWDLQESLLNAAVQQKLHPVAGEEITNYLLVCNHPHVYTLGKHGVPENLLLEKKELEEKGIDFFVIDRGGDITYHGPGQLVVYPILDLEQFGSSIKAYLHALEEAVIRMLGEFGIKGERLEGKTGVWIEPFTNRARKICAMGVRCSRWITIHGLALNINTDLSYFKGIVPCGIADMGVASMNEELNRKVDESKVLEVFLQKFEDVFEAQIVPAGEFQPSENE